MLILSRKLGEAIIINGNIRVTVVEIAGGKVRLGLKGPDDVKFLREEVQDRIVANDNPQPQDEAVTATPIKKPR